MPHNTLNSLLNPRSVAILGATDDPNRVGGRVMRYMYEAGFKGPIYPINPKRETVQGRKAYPSISDIVGTAELAILSIPARAVKQALLDCAEKGTKAAVVFSSGFAEMGKEGRTMQDELRDVTCETGIRLLGPNCLGAASVKSGVIASFSSNFLGALPELGSVAIVSQSGAFGAHLYSLARGRGIGLSHWLTTGNEVNITIAECLEFLVDQPEVNTIMVYAEGINDGAGLCGALEKAQHASKPIIFLKVGRTKVGAEAAKSHTASIAVSDVVVDALFKQYGVYRANTTDEMMDIAYASQMGVFPKGKKLAILSISGGVGVQMADLAIKYGLEVPAIPKHVQNKIRAILPFAGVRNPVDITAAAMEDPSLIPTTHEILLSETDCDMVATFLTPASGGHETADILLPIFERIKKQEPNKTISLNIIMPPDVAKRYEDKGFTVFDTPDRTVGTLAGLAKFSEAFERGKSKTNNSFFSGTKPDLAKAINEFETKRILAAIGMTVVREAVAIDAAEAVAFADEIGGPVVLKIVSPDIQHKTEMGGVIVGSEGVDEVRDGFETLMLRAKKVVPDAQVDGVAVAEMITGGVETVIGVNNDPTFGPVVIFGLGGIFIEIMKDVTCRLAPFGVEEAFRMIREISSFEILTGFRGGAAMDLKGLAETLALVSTFAAENAAKIESLDINPYMVLPKGGKVLDALIIQRS